MAPTKRGLKLGFPQGVELAPVGDCNGGRHLALQPGRVTKLGQITPAKVAPEGEGGRKGRFQFDGRQMKQARWIAVVESVTDASRNRLIEGRERLVALFYEELAVRRKREG